jgi:hypothetical protein
MSRSTFIATPIEHDEPRASTPRREEAETEDGDGQSVHGTPPMKGASSMGRVGGIHRPSSYSGSKAH